VLINLLINIKNASIVGKESFYVPYNKLCLKMLNLLYDEGLSQSVTVITSLNDNQRIKIV
jgi:ribosomal protein S8